MSESLTFKDYQVELLPRLSGEGSGFSEEEISEATDPINAFKADVHIKENALEHALDHGDLLGVSFQACPPFSKVGLKNIRREALRAARISEIIAQKDPSKLDSYDRIIIDHAERATWRHTLIEAARRSWLAESGQSNDDPEFCANLMRDAMEFLYSAPERELALDSAGTILTKIERARESAEPEQVAQIDRFLVEYPFMVEGRGRSTEVLSKSKEAEIKSYFESLCTDVFARLHAEFPEINNDLVVSVTKRYLELRGFSEKGWKVEDVGPPRIGFAVIPEQKIVEHGTRTIPATWRSMEGLLIHEIERHVASAQAGHEVKFVPLAVGLPNSEDAEEGIAKTYQKAWDGTASKKGLATLDHYRYLIGSYGYGSLDGQYHNADETFRFISRLKELELLSNPKNSQNTPEEITKKARKQMFEQVYRAYRGMPDDLVFIKDLAYLSGTVKIAELINQSHMPADELVGYLNRGKFDPTNPEHQKIVQQIYAR